MKTDTDTTQRGRCCQAAPCSPIVRGWRRWLELGLLAFLGALLVATIALPSPYMYLTGWAGIALWLPLELLIQMRRKRGEIMWANVQAQTRRE